GPRARGAPFRRQRAEVWHSGRSRVRARRGGPAAEHLPEDLRGASAVSRRGRPALPARIGLSVQRRTTGRAALGPGAIEVAPLAPSVAALGAAAKKICDPALGISGT